MGKAISFFQSRQKLLFFVASLYVVLLLVSHSQLPAMHVWVIAAVFSSLMNFTYITEALAQGKFVSMEASIAGALIVISILGVFVSPIFVITAIFAHGCWDIAKHRGAGIPFISWYTLGCFLVDMLYSATLLVYWLK